MRRTPSFVFILALVALLGVFSASAQDGNLLRDPGFEGQFTGRGRDDLNIPADWGLWFTETPRTDSWMNQPPVAFPHRGPDPDPHSGAIAMNFNNGFKTYTAAIYQQVVVPENANVTGSAWGWLHTCNIAANTDKCGSAVESGAYMRVGIDPRGGTNPYDPGIIWSGNALPHDRWDQISVTATAQGANVTLFLFTTQQWPSQLNKAYWDDASLTVGGAGGVSAVQPGTTPGAPPPTLVPTAPPFVNFVSAQAAQSDGSIIHRVQSGDTVDSIAYAYGVSRAEIVELNGMRDPRLIQIGQELIIRPPGSVETTTEVAAASVPATLVAATGSTGTSPELAQTRDAFSTIVAATVQAALPGGSAVTPTPTATRLGATTDSGSLLGGETATPLLDAMAIIRSIANSGAPGHANLAALLAGLHSQQTNSSSANAPVEVASAGVAVASANVAAAAPAQAVFERAAVTVAPVANNDGSVNFGPTNAIPTATPFQGIDEGAPAPIVSVASGAVLPAMDPNAASATLCVSLFNDANANRVQETGEQLLAGGNISLMKGEAQVDTYRTDGVSEPHCTRALEPGDYTVSAQVEGGLGLTTPAQFRVRAVAGSTINVAFGAAEGVAAVVAPARDALVNVANVTGGEAQRPLADVQVGSPTLNTLDMNTPNLGFIVLGLAGAVILAGAGLTLLLRRR